MNTSMQDLQFDSHSVEEKGQGVRFDLPQLGPHVTGFLVRFEGRPYAYVNRCAHVPVELDWEHGKFFNLTQEFIICATHGAMYAPQTGQCVIGPCTGKHLTVIPVSEKDGTIHVHVNQL